MSETIISERNALERLNSKDNLCNLLKKEVNGDGSGTGTGTGIVHKGTEGSTAVSGYKKIPVPDEARVLAAAFGRLEGYSETHRNFGFPQKTISRSAKGVIGEIRLDPELVEKTDSLVENIQETTRVKALDRLNKALNHITEDKLAEAKLREISSVAKDMASVIEKTGPKGLNPGSVVQFNIFAPREKKEEDYQVIEVITT